MEIKSAKVVKSLEGFCFKATTSALYISESFFALFKSSISPVRLQRTMKKSLLLRQFFEKILRLFNAYLIIFSLEKEIIAWKRVWKKS